MAASRAMLLLVEDDDHLRRWVVESLRDASFAITARSTLDGARESLREPCDLILLDLGLPDGDGLGLCAELRARGNRTPIIVLTARGAPEERVRGLDAGADDYLTKPFHPRELVARIQAVLRRSQPIAEGTTLSSGEIWVDPETRTAGKGVETLELKRLEVRDSRRSEWVAQVAHDLRTPLAALTTCLDRASDQLDRGTDETDELRELLCTARLDATRVGTLAEDLLEIARLEIEEIALTEPVPPGEIVQDVVRGLQPIATDRGIRCEVEIAPDVPVATADGRLICRALENLVVNSLQHARGAIAVRAHGAGEKVRFEVEDDGPGLPERDGQVLFSELKQQRSRADSAGLGLIVAQRVAQAHGGELGARNTAGGGAVVWFEIPVSPE